MFIDAHCHLSDPIIVANIEKYVSEALKLGLKSWVLAGYDLADWRRQLGLGKKLDLHKVELFKAFGIHPWVLATCEATQLEREWRELVRMVGQCQAIGETGLDFFRDSQRLTYDRQVDFFHRHVKLAIENDKPLILHVVRGHGEILNILRASNGARGIVHGFRSSAQIAAQYVDLGFKLSFPATSLLRNIKLRDVFCKFRAHALLETDAPNCKDAIQENPLICLVKDVTRLAEILDISVGVIMGDCYKIVQTLFYPSI